MFATIFLPCKLNSINNENTQYPYLKLGYTFLCINFKLFYLSCDLFTVYLHTIQIFIGGK